jgi:hypothetical protein
VEARFNQEGYLNRVGLASPHRTQDKRMKKLIDHPSGRGLGADEFSQARFRELALDLHGYGQVGQNGGVFPQLGDKGIG